MWTKQIPYEAQNQWCVSAWQKEIPPIMQTSGWDDTGASIYIPSISKVIISFFVNRLTLKNSESVSMLVIYLWNLASDQTMQLSLVTCTAVKNQS